MSYSIKSISNYEGFKRLDAMLQKVDSGKLKPPREPKRDELCDICHRRVRAFRIVPSSVAGRKLTGLPAKFQGRFVVACEGRDGCAAKLERAGVPQKARAEAEAMARLGLVMP